jgi:hypothetical protein
MWHEYLSLVEVEPLAYETKDSGKRESFATGAVRDTQDGKVRYSLVPIGPMERVAALYTRGAAKYDDDNWRRGMPFKRVIDSLLRHLTAWRKGEADEDHLAAVVFNAMALMEYEDAIRNGNLPPELDDRRALSPGAAGGAGVSSVPNQ